MPYNERQENVKMDAEAKIDEIKDKVFDINFSEIQIEDVLISLKAVKAAGIDFIAPDMLKCSKSHQLIRWLALIYTEIFRYELILDNFNVSRISPIPKSKSRFPTNPDEYPYIENNMGAGPKDIS